MATISSLADFARELLEHEWQRMENAGALHSRNGNVAHSMCLCPPVWLLPDLLAMVEESHDRPVRELTPTIRRMILEHNFVDAIGDGLIESDEQARVERLVQVLVKVLEKVRKTALDEGQWSEAPVTPLMFG